MKRARRKSRPRLMLALVAMGLTAQPVEALETSPFARFVGNWRGNGQVLFTNGGAERINCRASYLSSSSRELSIALVCATQSYRIEIRSELNVDGRQVRGNWTEATHQVTGTVVGQIASGVFEGSIAGPGFDAAISLRSNGRRQLVSIRPQSADLQVASVDVDLLRQADQ